MFSSMWTKQFARAACLLCGVFMGETALAGPIPPPVSASEIDGSYDTNLGDQPQSFPLSFLLSNGQVTSPTDLSKFTTLPNSTGLTAEDLNVAETSNGGNPPQVTVTLTPDFILTGTIEGVTGNIDYTINSSKLTSGNVITSEVTLNIPNTTLTTVDLANLNPAILTITFFPNGGNVNLDPSWPEGYSGPVYFSLTAVPEPATIIHLVWVGAFGLMGYCRRHRRAAMCSQSCERLIFA